MPNLFDEFIGCPIDWENPLNMPRVFQIGTEYAPDRMLTEIRASSIDPNDLISIGDLLVEFKLHDHAKVAWEEGVRQLEAQPSRMASDVNLLNVKCNLCRMCLPSAPLEGFKWVLGEPKIIETEPALGLRLAATLSESKNFEEAETVLVSLEKFPVESLARFFPDVEKGTQAINELRVSVRRNLCFGLMPSKALEAFGWIQKEPSIVQSDPKLALAVLASLVWELHRHRDATQILSRIDSMPIENIASMYPNPEKVIDGLSQMRAEVNKNMLWHRLPSWWNDLPRGDVHRLIGSVDQNLQRRVGMGHSDTIGFIRQLAITGDRRAIPILRKAARHERRSVRSDAAVALYALGDPEGVTELISDYRRSSASLDQHAESDVFHIVSDLECIRDPRAEAVVSEHRASKASSPVAASTPAAQTKSGCFIATAACGDPFAPEVIALSAFRDDVLLQHCIGRGLVRLYYVVSPPIAAAISRSAALRHVAMTLFVTPVSHLVRYLWERR